MSATEIAHVTGGTVLTSSGDARATSVTIDSRATKHGALFVALSAARDGHDFVDDSFEAGASIALVEREVASTRRDVALVKVSNTVRALSALAHEARRLMRDVVVVGITGSAGKTATKNLTQAALARTHRVHASPASFNNEAGLPLTLLGAPDDVQVVVAEMGARFEHNIADLAKVAEPQVGVITHIGLAHAGHLGGRDGITRVKGELIEALPASGLAVLNGDCDRSAELATLTSARVLRVGRAGTNDVRTTDITLDADLQPRFTIETPWGTAAVALSVRGEHQVENAAQAAVVALELGAPLDDVILGLGDARGEAQRMELVRTPDGVIVLNDAYNSSPTSAAAAVRSLASLDASGRRIAVLGEMLELGDSAAVEHEAIGALAGAIGIDLVVAVGAYADSIAKGASGTHTDVVTVADPVAASEVLAQEVRSGDAVLVKASRAIGLERVAEELVRAGVRP
ncbi:MAG: UDP-N-acetylmuramoyl-tripeptide--D-alanyl-D-alanine ligase [Actinobacteria bacterium]|nr:UDP-N-acetylmuramoyl-tripeptide--D-alanyl-D-alanine ligase [Actinomycetota bacterium]